MERYTWVEFYKELADQLLKYRGRGKELVDKVAEVYAFANDLGAGIQNNITSSQIAKYNITDLNNIDPFTVFGVINRDLVLDKRIKLCEGFKKVFFIESDVPSDFDGIPVFQNKKSWVIANDYDVWDLIDAAIRYADTGEGKKEFIEKYNVVYSRKTSLAYITFGLFWIRPLSFISYDANTVHYIKDNYPDLAKYVATTKPMAEDYLSLCEAINGKYEGSSEEKSNLELSYNAYIYSKSFVFQCNPKNYDIVEALNHLDKMVYSVKSLKKEVVPGSRVYIWVSGADGGIIAKARIISELGHYSDPDGDAFYKVEHSSGPVEGVWIEFTEKRQDSIITKAEINSVKGMESYSLSQGTNFRASMEQARIFDLLISGKTEQLEFVNKGDKESDWYPSKEEYDSGITKEKWLEILPDLLSEDWGRAMAMFYVEKDGATCKTVGKKYGIDFNSIRSNCTQLAKRVAQVTGCPVIDDGEKKSYWAILFYGKNSNSKDEGSFMWKLKPELYDALTEINVLKWLPKTTGDDEVEEVETMYSPDDFLTEVYVTDRAEYDTLVNLLETKKNIILKGAPGVGKTFVAKRLAYSILGKKKDSNIKVVQFHQNYSYEDFVEGYKPKQDSDGFVLTDGVFKSFCNLARNSSEKFFFIIDEINRGNLSKIFGELLMLIEEDKRGKKEYEVELAYSKQPFTVPENVYIIGMMNTADRSLALIDYALRRRFSFYEIEPKFDNETFKNEMKQYGDSRVMNLVDKIDDLNKNTIEKDPSLGKGFMIGHSYFCNKKADETVQQWLYRIVEYDIIPTFEEYWYDRDEVVRKYADELRNIIKDEPEQ